MADDYITWYIPVYHVVLLIIVVLAQAFGVLSLGSRTVTSKGVTKYILWSAYSYRER